MQDMNLGYRVELSAQLGIVGIENHISFSHWGREC
jgi:hypothetical protein